MHYKWYREADEKIKQLENEKNELSQSEISERLRLRRIVMNLSQREAAEKIGYSTAAVNAWENGKCSPNAEALADLVKIYNCSADFILGLTDDASRKGE